MKRDAGIGKAKPEWWEHWINFFTRNSPRQAFLLSSIQGKRLKLLLTNVSIWISAVQFVLVIQVNRISKSLLRRLGPLQNFLGPVHSEEAVHLAFCHHLFLDKQENFLTQRWQRGVHLLQCHLSQMTLQHQEPNSQKSLLQVANTMNKGQELKMAAAFSAMGAFILSQRIATVLQCYGASRNYKTIHVDLSPFFVCLFVCFLPCLVFVFEFGVWTKTETCAAFQRGSCVFACSSWSREYRYSLLSFLCRSRDNFAQS